ncbi:MAG: threonine synthase [Pseudomonadota bacterium]|nr:threonine synthase [Pseudomonadota bacterium]MEC9078421.1 threonine synthase [Pseudomonadota bacterium]
MEYISTRGKAPVLNFEEVMLAGLADDGGLYVPLVWPKFSTDEILSLRGLSYPEIAEYVISPFVDNAIDVSTQRKLIKLAYQNFGHSSVAPLRRLDKNVSILELFHGPTLAFKDFALQLLGYFFEEVLRKRGERVTIVGATSGDTGSAAIEACKNRDPIDIFILHPDQRTSEIQRRQMTTVTAKNVHNIAIQGTFDDCQDLVKAMFRDRKFRESMNLSAVNSINWARIMAQIVYYFSSALALGAPETKIAYSVPTGNFGDIFAGYAAKKMGLPINKLIVGTNSNDILERFFASGDMSARAVVPTLSPAMDIQVSSNFERLLFDLAGNDPDVVNTAMSSFRDLGQMKYPPEILSLAQEIFYAASVDDEETLRVIESIREDFDILIDPHTATAISAGKKASLKSEVEMVVLSTAHPAKFPDAVIRATGEKPELPHRLSHILDAPEFCTKLPNKLEAVMDHIRQPDASQR